MRIGVVIPVYNHGQAVGAVVAAVRSHGLPLLLVDDGSEPGCAAELERLSRDVSGQVALLRLPQNQGKGGAMIAGLREAARLGWTHVLQIDADGQHDAADIPAFVLQAGLHPQHLICGCPLYDESVPRARLLGRYATHVWVWINTLSMTIKDSMCGFRIYPLPPTLALLDRAALGRRMDFDIEIVVRLVWRGVEVINQPTRVSYPSDGVSHFRVLRDNLLISALHTRLFFGMLLRAPALLRRRLAS